MPTFKERKDKFKIEVPTNNDKIKMRIDCFNGTVNKLSFFDDDEYIITIQGGQTGVVGESKNLENDLWIFNGVGKDLDDSGFKVKHTLYRVTSSEDEELMSYTFPDDYTGSEPWVNPAGKVRYRFFVDFL